MKKVIITISYYSYINLRQILQGIEKICDKREYVFISKNQIPPELVLVPMLKDRNLFLYDAQKTFDGYPAIKDFKFEYYQIAALYQYLNNIADLPDNVKLIRMTCNEIIEDNTKVIVKSDFQIWFEKSYLSALSFTELREEFPFLYNMYEQEFNHYQQDLRLTTGDGSLEKPQDGSECSVQSRQVS